MTHPEDLNKMSQLKSTLINQKSRQLQHRKFLEPLLGLSTKISGCKQASLLNIKYFLFQNKSNTAVYKIEKKNDLKFEKKT